MEEYFEDLCNADKGEYLQSMGMRKIEEPENYDAKNTP